MHLPNELLLYIFQSLGRTDLKSARLVCKSWDPCASHFLFDKIYVSPNEIDLQVFEAIAQHPILSKSVRHLVYDASVFVSDLTRERYVEQFIQQASRVMRKGDTSLENTDPRIVNLIRHCDLPKHIIPKEYVKRQIDLWKDNSFFRSGYQVYQEHSVYQARALQSGYVLQALVLGLSRLSSLESVSLQGEWTPLVVANLGEHHYGTPLARKWNPFICLPRRWLWESGTDRHVGVITAALNRAKSHVRRIDKFAIDGDFADEYLQRDRSRVNGLGLGSGVAARSGVKRLALNLRHGYLKLWEQTDDDNDNAEDLLKLLGSMHSLQCLHISASHYGGFESVFFKVMTWNNLEDFALKRLVSTTPDLLRLFLIQMPRLRNLVIGCLDLLDARCWSSFIECLRQFHQFRTFKIGHRGWFNSTWGKPHISHEPLDCDTQKLVDYVMNGGRHPCLSKEQPTSASEAYMLRIDASLLDSLYEMRRSRTQPTIRTS